MLCNENTQTTHTRSPLRWHGRDWVNKDGNLICGLKRDDAPNHRSYSILFSFQLVERFDWWLESLSVTHPHTQTHTLSVSLCSWTSGGDSISVSQIKILNKGRVDTKWVRKKGRAEGEVCYRGSNVKTQGHISLETLFIRLVTWECYYTTCVSVCHYLCALRAEMILWSTSAGCKRAQMCFAKSEICATCNKL